MEKGCILARVPHEVRLTPGPPRLEFGSIVIIHGPQISFAFLRSNETAAYRFPESRASIIIHTFKRRLGFCKRLRPTEACGLCLMLVKT